MNEIVRSLAEALDLALSGDRPDGEAPYARDVAQVLGLDGLDRALGVCQPGAAATAALESRIRELRDESAACDSLEPFLAADRELARRALEHGGIVEGELEAPREGTIDLLAVLAPSPLDAPSTVVARRARLEPPVAAALRAALGWLAGDGPPAPVRVRLEDSAVDLVVGDVDLEGVESAAAVLAAAGGNLGPSWAGARAAARSGDTDWVVRVPVATSRPTYLMLHQGELALAVPAHAVLRLCMIPRGELDASVRALGLPVLPPCSPLSTQAAEYPVVLIASGLKRGYLVADRLVWRLPARDAGADPDPRAPGLDACVETDDGQRYRVADAATLLTGITDLEVAEPEPETGGADRAAAAMSSTPGGAAIDDAVGELAPERVEPVFDDPAWPAAMELQAAPLRDAASAGAAVPELDPSRVTPIRRRALVAEDSISARAFLTGLLEQAGFEVHAVATAGELLEVAAHGDWAVAFVDVDLPDARSGEVLEAMRARAADGPLVALVRDRLEARAARDTGVPHALAKPFERERLNDVLRELGLARESS